MKRGANSEKILCNRSSTNVFLSNSNLVKIMDKCKKALFVGCIFMLSCFSFSQTSGHSSFYCEPCHFMENSTIKFSLSEDSYVRLSVIDRSTDKTYLLVDGTIASGLQGIVFRRERAHDNSELIAKLEIFDENGELLREKNEIFLFQFGYKQ